MAGKWISAASYDFGASCPQHCIWHHNDRVHSPPSHLLKCGTKLRGTTYGNALEFYLQRLSRTADCLHLEIERRICGIVKCRHPIDRRLRLSEQLKPLALQIRAGAAE